MSSFYEDASLVMIPSGYKTSKVYSAKPTDGAGDLVFTRSNDTATRVGPDGLIEKVRTNLILQSNSFSDAAWVKLGVGTGTAPVLTANYTATSPPTTSPLLRQRYRLGQWLTYLVWITWVVLVLVCCLNASGRIL
jgi:hypothetical protein